MLELQLKAVKALLIGLWICALCALFPPRRAIGRPDSVPRGFLFMPTIQWSSEVPYSSSAIEIDAGRLVGESLFILSVSALFSLYYLRECLTWKKEELENTPVQKS